MRLMLAVGLLCAAVPSLPAQAEDPAQLVARLTGEGRVAAHRQLVALGAKAVPALIDGLRVRHETALPETLAVLSEIGADASPAVGALLELVDAAKNDEKVCLVEVLSTLADLAPFRGPEVSCSAEGISTSMLHWGRQKRRGGLGIDREASLAFARLRVRLEFPLDLELQELIGAARACNAYRAEVAIELLGRRGLQAEPALPTLQAVLSGRDPRVLTKDCTVPLRNKAARAILAIAAVGEASEQARAVLAGGGPQPVPEMAVPERARARVLELLCELKEPAKRDAAAANLVALDTLAVMPLAEELQQEHDVGYREAALAVLRGLGPRATAAVPVLLEMLTVLPVEHTVSLVQTLTATAPWCRNVVPPLWSDASVGHLEIHDRAVPGNAAIEILNAFNEASALLRAAMLVDPAYRSGNWKSRWRTSSC